MPSDGGVTDPTTLRAKAGRIAQRILPNIDEWQWNRHRDREISSLLKVDGYRESFDRLPEISHHAKPHLVIVPKDGPQFDNWCVAGGNFFFEITQAAREFYGEATVSVFSPQPDETVPQWHERLARYLIETGATHVMAMVETDPDGAGTWHWDLFWSQLARHWDGVFLGVVFDSSYRWISIPVRRVARMNERFVLVDIGMPIDGEMIRNRPEAGPVNMPVSNLSMTRIDERLGGLPKLYDVSFLGSLYPYRVELINALRARDVEVAVNPHQLPFDDMDLESSRAQQPSYLDYMAGLAQSHMTINFSRSSAGDFHQLKTRVLEAQLVGCLVLTDDEDRTGRFWIQDEEFVHFSEPQDVPTLVAALLADPVRLKRMQEAGQRRARQINISSFWGGIEDVLMRRHLSSIKSD